MTFVAGIAMRWSLKDLLSIFAFAAVISWCAGEVGYDAAFWIALFISSVASVVFVRAATSDSSRWAVLLTPLIAFMPMCLLVVSPSVALNAALLFAGALGVLLVRPKRAKPVWVFAMVVMAASFSWAALDARAAVKRLQAMREEFPVVSLAERLAYESRGERPASCESSSSKPLGLAGIRLDEFEQQLDGQWRANELEMVHGRQYEQFVRSMGFGIMRMPRPSSDGLRRPPLRNLAFNELSDLKDYDWALGIELRGQNSATYLHEVGRDDFLHPDGFGYVPEAKTSAGFVEHGMHYSPVNNLEDPDAWTIERLELVSLLKFDEPRVYVLDHLPRMDQLSSDDVPTRALDEFEQQSLKKLWTDEDIVIEQQDDVYRMLGSLRAAKQCLDCHSVERGELLGAFTYVLRRGEKGALDLADAGHK
jgi:hypothetical protein